MSHRGELAGARFRYHAQLYDPSECSAALGPCHVLLLDAEGEDLLFGCNSL